MEACSFWSVFNKISIPALCKGLEIPLTKLIWSYQLLLKMKKIT
jgi:hypothetical protein